MSRGILLFAQGNPELDYIKLAVFCAKRIKKYLEVPVSLATDSKEWLLETHPDAPQLFDQIISCGAANYQTRQCYDGSMFAKDIFWNNLSRSDCYDLTPYQETIVLDTDYIVSSKNLNKVWGNQQDFLIYKNSYDIAQWRDTTCFSYVNTYAVPFYWATVFYFKKNKENQAFFRLVKHIKDNWSYYRVLYLIDSPLFRNDFAFSIAIHIMSGCMKTFSYANLPGKLYYTLDRDILLDLNEASCKFLLEKEKYHGEYTLAKTENLDVHVMNKFSLSRLIDGVKNV